MNKECSEKSKDVYDALLSKGLNEALCHEIAYKLASIFKLPQAIETLRATGIKVINSSLINSVNEFINGSRWPRCDIEIDMLCNFKITLENYMPAAYAESVALPVNILND